MGKYDGLFTNNAATSAPKSVVNSGNKYSGMFSGTMSSVPGTVVPPVQDTATNVMATSNSPYKLSGTTTISQAPTKVVPFGRLGKMVKAAYDVTKSSVDNLANKVLSAFNASDSSGVNLQTSEQAPGFSKYNVDGTADPNYEKELKARQDFLANAPKETALTRGLSIGGVAVGAVNLYPPIAIFNAELAAAKELPGPLSAPAKAVDWAFQKVSELGGTGIGLGIDKLQKEGAISKETADTIKPFGQEIASIVTLIVGTHLGFKAMEKGVGGALDKLPISGKTKANINKGVQLGVGFSMQPFSTAYGIVSAKVATKVQERKAKGIEITPEEGKKIMEEVKAEMPAEITKSGEVPTTPTTEFSGLFDGKKAPVEPKTAPGEATRTKLDIQDYNTILKPKIEALPKVGPDETMIIKSGDGPYVDTNVDVALNRGVNQNTRVEIVKTSELKLPDNTGKVARGERLFTKPATTESPLTTEASKYKSAEEFVKAQGTTLYSGSKAKYEQFDFKKADKGGLYGNSAYLTPDAKRALSYGDNVTEYIVPKNAKLLKESVFESRVSSITPTIPYGDITVARAKAVEQFIKEGYDGVKTKDTTAIFNPKVLQTKSQLTDIWNKAKKVEQPITINGEPLKVPSDLPNVKQKVFKPDSKIAELKTEIENLQATIDQSPLKKLSKYARNGELPEVLGTKKGGKFQKTGDDIASELGFEYSEQVRDAYEQYNASRLKLADLKNQLRETKSQTFSDYTEAQLDEINRMAQETTQSVNDFKKTLDYAGSPKPIETGGDRMTSRVFERMKAENPSIEGDVGYDLLKLQKDAQKAVELVATDKQKAYDIAMGKETSSEVTSTAVNIAMAEKALQDGNLDLYARLVRNRSLEQTRRGQELVAERGSVTDNSTAKYVKELIASKLDKLGKTYLSDIRDNPALGKFKRVSDKGKGMKIIDKKMTELEKQIKSGKLDTKTAIELLDKLTCI